MSNVITFQEAIDMSTNYTKRHLLLGNGFSIAFKHDIFTYKSLFDEADFSNLPEIPNVFKELDVIDFESVIKALQESSKIISIYSNDVILKNKLKEHSDKLKETLVTTLAGKHPDSPFTVSDIQYKNVRTFLSNFLGKEQQGNIYTLNYDLLLYWAIMHDEDLLDKNKIEIAKGDGFGKEEGNRNAEYVIWHGESKAHSSQRIHYLHGALHLFDSGKELKKFTWINTGCKLIDQTKESLDRDMYPLFVSEGTSEQKLTKIKHSAFLYHSFKSFAGMMNQPKNCLFIYGHSLAINDMHILHKVALGKVPQIFVSIYGDINSEDNQKIVLSANQLKAERDIISDKKFPLKITYYDATSVNVW